MILSDFLSLLGYSNVNERDQILFGEDFDTARYLGGVRHFDDLEVHNLKHLVDAGFADPEESQNCAPTTYEILEFLMAYPGYVAHGYAVSPERIDCRISIEGVAKESGPDSISEAIDFVNLFRGADEFEMDEDIMYCWYD